MCVIQWRGWIPREDLSPTQNSSTGLFLLQMWPLFASKWRTKGDIYASMYMSKVPATSYIVPFFKNILLWFFYFYFLLSITCAYFVILYFFNMQDYSLYFICTILLLFLYCKCPHWGTNKGIVILIVHFVWQSSASGDSCQAMTHHMNRSDITSCEDHSLEI